MQRITTEFEAYTQQRQADRVYSQNNLPLDSQYSSSQGDEEGGVDYLEGTTSTKHGGGAVDIYAIDPAVVKPPNSAYGGRNPQA